MLSNKEISEGIAAHNSQTLHHVYKEMFPFVESYVLHQGGSREQAKDLFQEGMIIVYNKISSGDFSLVCKFSTYLYAVCKRIWIQDRKKQIQRLNKLKDYSIISESEVPYGREHTNEAKEIFDKHFKKLSPDCQQILSMYFNGITIEEIREVMEITTVHHASDKKYRCKKNLIEKIKNDPKFRKYTNE